MHRGTFKKTYKFSVLFVLGFLFSWCLHSPLVLSQEKEVKILPGKVTSYFREGAIPLTDPLDKAWFTVPTTKVALVGQNAQEPKLMEPSVSEIQVRSLNNGDWIVFHLEWEDATKNDVLRVDRFTDGVAVELPLYPANLPDHRMGSDGEPVHLMLWKAHQQKAHESGISFTVQNYPHMWSDYYLFERYCDTPACIVEKKKVVAAHAAGNPVIPGSGQVVEELYAETWNKVMHQKDQHARGRGVWKDGRWYVVIARPMLTPDPQDAPLDEGSSSYVAFAAWEGGAGNQGPRKMVTDGWLSLEIGK